MKSKFLRTAALAGLLSLAAIGGAFALFNDQTRIFNPRFDPNANHPSYYRVTINYNDSLIGNGQKFGALGANEFIKSIDCQVVTAFNASTNNVTFGITSAANEIMASSGTNASITPGTPGIYHVTAANGLGITATSAGTVQLWAKYAQTGTAATAGQVICILDFVPNNDM
jgi:predicted ribosomally synthesized peptide with SipW-like signal peptide